MSTKHNLIAVIVLVRLNDIIAPPMRLIYRL
jgi:hypothetical protein